MAPDGVMDPNIYLALVTIHGTIMVFFVLQEGLVVRSLTYLFLFKLVLEIWHQDF